MRVLAAAANADGQAWLHLSSRLLVVYASTSSLNSHQAWLHLSSRLRSISETGLRKALLEGGTAEHAAGDPRPLLLWSPLCWEADTPSSSTKNCYEFTAY